MTGWKKEKNHQRRRDASRQPSHRFDSIRSIPEYVSKRRELREQSSVNAMTGLFRAIIRDTARKFITERYCPPGQGFKMRIATNPGLHGVRKDVRIPSVCV